MFVRLSHGVESTTRSLISLYTPSDLRRREREREGERERGRERGKIILQSKEPDLIQIATINMRYVFKNMPHTK